MRIPTIVRSVLVALIVLFGVGLHAAHADSGSVVLTVFKGGWIIGARQATAHSSSAAEPTRSR